ncbi:MAG: hypothetical protein GY847_02015 [Proteobacteria bacterium]|nr:hypothetical protein [Pseudomonadota bacterium]
MVNDWDFAITDASMVTGGAPVQPGFVAPRFTLVDGRVFPNRRDIIEVRGLWGYTEDDGTAYGRTPLEIRRACMLLVIRQFPPLGDTNAVADARSQWRIIEEKTRDQSYKLDKPAGPAPITGDPEIDSVLIRYRRPPGLAAV